MFFFIFSLILAGSLAFSAGEQLTDNEIRLVLISAGWASEGPEVLEEAFRVSLCESSHIWDAVGEAGELGLFQLSWYRTDTWHGFKFSAPRYLYYKDVRQPVANAMAALYVYRLSNSWEAWTCQP
tara:strand:+ start:4239 stop:4613 length:375 start_codon:yes stop_codon:yes gene_type:complete